MGRRISERLHRISTGWVTLAAVVVFALFTALVLPGQASPADTAAEAAGSPDLSFSYSTGDLYAMAKAYGPEGRAAYVRARYTFDVVWPVVYTAFLVTTISWLARRIASDNNLWQRANLIPLLAATFDFFENASTSLVMARYPARTPVIAILATVFTPVKWLFVTASLVLLLVFAFAALWRSIRKTH